MKRRVLLGSALAVGIVAVLVAVRWWSGWGQADLVTPMPLPTLNGEILVLDGSEIVRRGSNRVLVVRLNGPAELVPHHFADEKLKEPMVAEAWASYLNAPLVFNAGQFDENLDHLGWLKRDDKWLTRHRKGQWMALLLSGPKDDAAWARIADLDQADPSVEARYAHVVQSMMLVDHAKQVRVRETDKAACRTVVAEDQQGRILVMVTEGAVTLADLARWLTAQDLGIVRAMNLDGGVESQMVVNTPELQHAFYGQHGTGNSVFEAGPAMIRYPLPAVVAVVPK